MYFDYNKDMVENWKNLPTETKQELDDMARPQGYTGINAYYMLSFRKVMNEYADEPITGYYRKGTL